MVEEYKKRQTAHKVSVGIIFNALEKGKGVFEEDRFKYIKLDDKDLYRINIIGNVIDKFESSGKPYASITVDDGTGSIRVKFFADSLKLCEKIELGDTIKLIGILRSYNEEIYVLPEILKTTNPKWLLIRKLELIKEYGKNYESIKPEKQDFLNDYSSSKSFKPDFGDNGDSNNSSNSNSNLNTNTFSKSQNQQVQQTIPKEEDKYEVEKILDSENVPNSNTLDTAKKTIIDLRNKLIDMLKQAEESGGLDVEEIIMDLKEPVESINKEITSLLEEGTIYEPKPGKLRIL